MEEIKILILDDRPEDIELIMHQLKKADFKFRVSKSATKDEFVDKLEKFKPDVILSDYNLVNFSGTEALEISRSLYQNIPFIIVSGFIGEEEAVDLIVDTGVSDYIIKDNLNKLNTSILRELDRYELHQQLARNRKELENLSLVASHTHNGVLIADKNLKVEWVNEAYQKLSGFSFEHCVGKKVTNLLSDGGVNNESLEEIKSIINQKKTASLEIQKENKAVNNPWFKLDLIPILNDEGTLTKIICIKENITSRKTAESELKESLQRLKEAQTLGKLGHWDFNINTMSLTCSDSIFEIHGYDPANGIPSLSEILKIYSVEDRVRFRKILLHSLKTREQFEIDLKLSEKRNGGPVYVRVLGFPYKTSNGKQTSLKGISQDITEQILFEQEIQDTKDLLSSITNNVQGAVTRHLVHDDNREEIIFANQGVKDLFGYEPEEIIRESSLLWEQIHPDDIKYLQEIAPNSRKEKSKFDLTYRIIDTEGNIKWVRAISTLSSHRKDHIWDTIAFDVTDLKKLELDVKRKNEQLIQVQEIAKMGYFEYYPETDEMIWSDELKQIFKIPLNEEPPSPSEQSRFYSPEAVNSLREKQDKCIAEKGSYEYVAKITFEDCSYKYIKTFSRYHENEHGIAGITGAVMDITNDKNKEQLLIESEQRLEAAIKGADIGIWDMNLVTGKNFTNSRWWEMLGYTSKDMSYSVDFFRSIIYHEDSEALFSQINNIENGAENQIDLILRIRSKSGELLRILNRGKVVDFDDEGKAVRVIGTHMDITERIELEAELSKTKTRIELAVEGAELGLWELDLKSGNTFYNSQWYEMLGYDKEDISFNVSTFIEIVHPDDLDKITQAMDEMINGTINHFEFVIRLRHKLGHYVWILDRAKVVKRNEDGSPCTIAGSHLDISGQIEAEKSYRESNIRLRALINSSPAGIYMINDSGRIIDFWNEAAEEIFGFTREEVMGNFLPHVRDDQRHEFQSVIARIKDGEALSNLRLARHHKNGSIKNIEINTGPIFNDDGELDSVLVIVKDITDLVKKESDLQDSLREKEMLLGEIHHRVKNNLAIVSGILELQRYNSGDAEILSDAVNRIRSIALVHEQLYKTTSFSKINIREYYEQLVRSILITSGINEPGDILKTDIKSQFININQAVPLGLLINELLTNSVKYALKNGGDEISLEMKQNEEGLHFFRYYDNGPGFDRDKLKNSSGMGWDLILNLLEQLHADHTIDTKGRFMLEFSFAESDRGSHSNLAY